MGGGGVPVNERHVDYGPDTGVALAVVVARVAEFVADLLGGEAARDEQRGDVRAAGRGLHRQRSRLACTGAQHSGTLEVQHTQGAHAAREGDGIGDPKPAG